MGFVHDDDDPFYDHEEATRSANAIPPPPARTALLRVTSAGRPTLNRSTSAGRVTATFDEFLSDSDSDDENDDGAAIERMQGQADDMEYIGSTFRLDSPNASVAGADNSFRMDAPPVAAAVSPAAATTTTTATWVARMSRAAPLNSDEDDDDSAPKPTSQPLAGLSESSSDARPSVDGLDSSCRLFSSSAVAGSGSGDFSDTSFVLNSPPEVGDSFIGGRPSNLNAGYNNSFDDSFTGDRPSNLDAGYSNNFDDSFTGDRPSNLNTGYSNSFIDSFTGDRPSNLDALYSETIDDSFTGDRPSNLDAGYSNSFGDSFTGDRPSNLDAGYSNSFIDSFASDRPSNLDAVYSETLDDSFASARPSNLDHDSLDDSFAGARPSTLRAGSTSANSPAADSGVVPSPDTSFVIATPVIRSIASQHEKEDAHSREGEASADGGRASAESDRFSAVGVASQSFPQDHRNSEAAAQEYGHDASDLGYRISTGSPTSFGSNHQSFFVGSVGLEADSTSYPLLASSPALSDVVMLGDDHGPGKSLESSSFGRRSFPLSASRAEAHAVEWQSPAHGSETIAASPDSSEQLPLLRRAATPLQAADPADGSPLRRRSSGTTTLGDSAVRPSKASTASASDALGASLLYRLSSPNAQANATAASFFSRAPGVAPNVDDSFSSSNASEIAARHLDRRLSAPSDGPTAGIGAGNRPDEVSPPLTAEALAATDNARENSVGGERPTDENLDFTGVYRSSGRSRDGARASHEKRNTVAKADSKPSDQSSFVLMTTPVSLVRARSDSVQRASERKVEDFFRRTRKLTMDDEDLSAAQGGTRQTRARTTVEFTLHEEREERAGPPVGSTDAARGRSKSAATKKLIDLKSLGPGADGVAALQGLTEFASRSRAVSRASTRLQIKEDLLEVPDAPALGRQSRLTFQSSSSSSSSGASGSSIDSAENRALTEKLESLQATRARQQSAANDAGDAGGSAHRGPLARSISSDAQSATENSPNMILMPPRFMLSPNAHAAASASGNARTPTLPSLSMGGSSLTPASPFTSSFAAASSAKAPFAMSGAGVASGFKWGAQEQLHQFDMRSDDSDGMSMKESIWHEAGIPRPTLSEAVASHLQRFSSSVRHTLRRTGARLFGGGGGNANETTSPKSVCSSPPKLARAFDDNNFYARFGRGGGVGDTDDVAATKLVLGRQRSSEQALRTKRLRALLTAAGAVAGVLLGLILIHIDALGPALTLSRAEQLQRQRVNGALSVAAAAQWILLPGKLFLRVWNCVALPLLFCHVLNGVADLAMHRKAQLALSFRSVGYMLGVSVIAAVEGVGMMAIVDALGVFRAATGGSGATSAAAAALRSRLGAAERRNGTVALKCEFDSSYLQAGSDGKSFRCSNKTIPLPVADGVSESGSNSSAAIFVLRDVNSVLATTSSARGQAYYPRGASLDQAAHDAVTALVPRNAVDALVHSTPVSAVVLALLLGLVCGKRAWERGIAAKQDPVVGSRIQLPRGPAVKPFYLLGVFVELQLALEWLAEALEALAPLSVLSLLAGSIVLHREELLTVVSPMVPLVLSVALACAIHAFIVSPALLKFGFGVNAFRSWGLTFLPAYVMCVGTGSVVLSLPTVQQCYERGNEVTKSMAQVSVGVLSVLHRSAHALYVPVAVLWLLQTSAPAGVDVELTTRLCVLVGVLAVISCFFAPHPVASVLDGTSGGGNLVLLMTAWRAVLAFSDAGAGAGAASPPTLPLLVACDVLLSRVVAATNLHGNMLVARIIAEHCDEVVVDLGTALPPPPAIRGGLVPSPDSGWL
ncbi:hypothetical protein PybrP1_002208 [[Pythium] brassicae (nom. inval.)]|nr:hypothetical protein PybrP1_002208 [[Pythium] brassicae (nom. inval.)]